MKRAMGGAGGFAAQSPNVLVARALHQAAASISSKRPDVPPELLRRGVHCRCKLAPAAVASLNV